MIQSVSILGSTGSIGTQALDVCRQYGITVRSMACRSNIDLLFQQIQSFHPDFVAVENESMAVILRTRMAESSAVYRCTVLSGSEGVLEVARTANADMVLAAMVGMVGIEAVLEAVRTGHDIALANKEVLVAAGDLVLREIKRRDVRLHPVDSEHSAIWQCLETGRRDELRRVLLTASGGPFRGRTKAQLEIVTVSEALKHPTWSMGAKISIDSATLMNKGLEIIEAAKLFDLDGSQIDVVVHPQSIVHSFVEWQDGSVIAQMGHPDMRLPIQLAFSWPRRLPCQERVFNPFSQDAAELSFEAPNNELFRALPLAYEALKIGGTMPLVLNAANEIAVEAFLTERIDFLNIAELCETMMNQHIQNGFILEPNLDDIMESDRLIRRQTKERI